MSNILPIENYVPLTYETKIIRPGRFFHWKVKVVREWPPSRSTVENLCEYKSVALCRVQFWSQEKKKEIWPSPMTKPPIPTENSKTKGQHTQTPPKTSITQRLRTDLGRSVGETSNPTGVVKPVYGIPTFPLTAKAV